MSGFEFLDRLKQDPVLTELPVIVLTSTALRPEERALLARASLILSKTDLASGSLTDAIGGVLRLHERVGVA